MANLGGLWELSGRALVFAYISIEIRKTSFIMKKHHDNFKKL